MLHQLILVSIQKSQINGKGIEMAIFTLGTNAWSYLHSLGPYDTLAVVVLFTAVYVSRISFLSLNLTCFPALDETHSILYNTHIECKETNLPCVNKYTLLAIYRVTLHPLAKYPGDFIDKITQWRLIYIEAHQKYGT